MQEPIGANPMYGDDPAKADETRLIVNSAVATVWSGPNRAREKDRPSILAAADIRAWTGSMDVKEKLWLVGKLETQVLYGKPVKLVAVDGDWAQVVVPGQPTSRNDQGYPGWMPLRQLAECGGSDSLAACPEAVVSSPTAFLYDDSEGAVPFMEISFNTRLPVVREERDMYVVQTPANGEKTIRQSETVGREVSGRLSAPSGEELVSVGKSFLGLPYLWAGMSGFGFDCSGFTHTLYDFFGILIPRDASDQAKSGLRVDRAELRPGDLLFFASNSGKGNVHHVGMYAGSGQMLHSPSSDRSIEIIPLDTPSYSQEFAGARRYIPE
jgi:cell wall-associated NlpC family hydrolase